MHSPFHLHASFPFEMQNDNLGEKNEGGGKNLTNSSGRKQSCTPGEFFKPLQKHLPFQGN